MGLRRDFPELPGIPRTTLNRYLELLTAVFLIKQIPAWSASHTHRTVGTPKLAFTDSGIACHLIGQDATRLGEPDGASGQMNEMFVVMELARQLTWSSGRARRCRQHFLIMPTSTRPRPPPALQSRTSLACAAALTSASPISGIHAPGKPTSCETYWLATRSSKTPPAKFSGLEPSRWSASGRQAQHKLGRERSACVSREGRNRTLTQRPSSWSAWSWNCPAGWATAD